MTEPEERGGRGPGRRRPAYDLIARTLRQAILDGRLDAGLVLTESALSSLFAASRSPVKQAFARLEAERLVRRFQGRGVIVGGEPSPPLRRPLTAAMLGLASGPARAVRHDAWDALYYALERDLILASIFGRFRVNELALARHCGVGRTVARNLLLRAEAVGLLGKGRGAQWHVVALNETRCRDLHELRGQLEPRLAETAAGRIPAEVLGQVRNRLDAAGAGFASLGVQALDRLETDLHVTCLAYGQNGEMIQALRRTHCTFVVGKHIQAALTRRPQIDSFVDEHAAVLHGFEAEDGRSAGRALARHLSASHAKAVERLAAFRAEGACPDLPYLSPP